MHSEAILVLNFGILSGQEYPKSRLRAAKRGPGPTKSQPRQAQERPRTSQEQPKRNPRPPKTGVRAAKNDPSAALTPPRAPSTGPRAPQSGPKEARSGPRAAQSSPKSEPERPQSRKIRNYQCFVRGSPQESYLRTRDRKRKAARDRSKSAQVLERLRNGLSCPKGGHIRIMVKLCVPP